MMNDQEKTVAAAPVTGISEAERMAKIRELLVGPVIADESARVDKSVDRLDEVIKAQQDALSALQARVVQLEETHRDDVKRLRLRLLGMVEAMLADEVDLRARLTKHEALLSELETDGTNGDA